jgi:hypothetical protein
MAQTFTETIGMLDLVIGHLDNAGNAATLTAKGLDVAATKARLTAEKNNLVTLDAEQEALFVASQNKTKDLETATAANYMDASGMVDVIAGLYGKNTPAGKNILDLRANIRRSPDEPPPTPPGP